MGILSAVIATVANVSLPTWTVGSYLLIVLLQTGTAVPIYICAALYIFMAAIAVVFPFEPYGKRSS